MRIQSSGRLHYEGSKCVVLLGRDFSNYYLSLCPKYYQINGQRYESHITVVRSFENPVGEWGKYEGEIISFEYSPELKYDGQYYYLDCYSERIEQIRIELGLVRFRMNDCYHITIGRG